MAQKVREKVEAALGEVRVENRFWERAFAFAFQGLVYAQIWEDPVVDMAALDIPAGGRIVTIASGGCNALSYLVADPGQVVAIDLNTAHIALGRLKSAALLHLAGQREFARFFAEADSAANIAAYERHIRAHLDETSRRYWEGRDLAGRRRISGFARGVYKRGLLGGFIGTAHLIARLYRVDPREMLRAQTLDEQRQIFEARMAPIFDKRFVRWLCDQPASLFGLGIPPAQFDALAGDRAMADVLRRRLEKLACDFPLSENYFARQAFGRRYDTREGNVLPPYLAPENHATLRERASRIAWRHGDMTGWLAGEGAASIDRYVLLDAQDWMDDRQLNALWAEITRTAKPRARVLFRTAAEPSLLPGRVAGDILARWRYDAERSAAATRNDRSSIYGGAHLYVFGG
ncbi:MAG: BtaA family protein [Sphingomonadales bacterium]|nr:BtaA family protein [Sphingomonadales bacterium]